MLLCAIAASNCYEDGAIVCYGRIYEFRRDAEPAVLAALQAEGKNLPPGLRIEYVPETRRLFLARTYEDVIDEKGSLEQMAELARLTAIWGGDVLSLAIDAARTKK